MAYSTITPIAGQTQQGYLNVVDNVKRGQLGLVVQAVDNYWGYGEFMYVQFPASAAVSQGQLLTWSGYGDANGYQVAAAPVTANTGRPVGVAIHPCPNVSVSCYGWLQLAGNAVIKAATSVAAGATFGIDSTTAGQVTTNSAGRQVLNAVSIGASTNTLVKTATLNAGSAVIIVNSADGWVPGMALSGTGIAGGTTVSSIDVDCRRVTMSAAATAGGVSSVTGTFTGFIIAQINRPFLQGAIT